MKTAIFDMDGTLVDSMYYWRVLGVEFLQARGFEPPQELIDELHITSIRKSPAVIRRYFDIDMSDEAMNAEFDQRMNDHYAYDVSMKPGALEYLEQLHSRGVNLILATATWRELTDPLMARLGAKKYFVRDGVDHMICANEMGMGKSSWEYYPELCRRFSLDPADCVMFEDALYSIERAKRAGMEIWAIDEPTAIKGKTEIMALADRYFENWAQLLEK